MNWLEFFTVFCAVYCAMAMYNLVDTLMKGWFSREKKLPRLPKSKRRSY